MNNLYNKNQNNKISIYGIENGISMSMWQTIIVMVLFHTAIKIENNCCIFA